MILPIHVYGSSVLRRVAQPLEEDPEKVNELVSNMYETMYNAEGLGLAGPQVGVSNRIIIIDATCMKDEYPELADFKKVFINPVKKEVRGEAYLFNEGCLSLPGIREDVERQSEFCMDYLDEDLIPRQVCFDGIKARILMHEYDHLEGVLFVDHLSSIKKKMLKGRLNALVKGKGPASYKTVVSK